MTTILQIMTLILDLMTAINLIPIIQSIQTQTILTILKSLLLLAESLSESLRDLRSRTQAMTSIQ